MESKASPFPTPFSQEDVMLLLLSLLATTALTPLPVDDEPKPTAFEFTLKQDVKEVREPAKVQSDHRYTFLQNARPTLARIRP
jgi:hypothetical protein